MGARATHQPSTTRDAISRGAHEDDPSDMDDFEDELMDVHVEHMPEMDDEDEYVVTQGPTALWQCHIVGRLQFSSVFSNSYTDPTVSNSSVTVLVNSFQ